MAKFPHLHPRREKTDPAESVAVIGLGRFGSALAHELMGCDTEVLGIDANPDIVQAHNRALTHVVRADATNVEALNDLGLIEMDRVVVGIGSNLEASILTTSLLLQLGITDLWAKAVSDAHALILEQLGVEHIVVPERDTGKRVAHLVRHSIKDYMLLGDDFALVSTTPPRWVLGKPLLDLNIRDRYGVAIIAFRRPGKDWQYTQPSSIFGEDDLVFVAGPSARAEAFGQSKEKA